MHRHSVVSNFLWPFGPQPTRLLCPWDSSCKNTGVGCHFPPLGDFPNPGIKPAYSASPALQADSLLLSHQRRPYIFHLFPDSLLKDTTHIHTGGTSVSSVLRQVKVTWTCAPQEDPMLGSTLGQDPKVEGGWFKVEMKIEAGNTQVQAN